MAKVRAPERRLRVALVFGGTIQREETLDKPRDVTLGYTDQHILPLPEGVTEDAELTLLSWDGTAYTVRLAPSLSGAVWVGGQRREVAALRALGQPVTLGPDDYGVVTMGGAAVFFQMVKRAPRIGMGAPQFLAEPARLLALMLSIFLHAAFLALLFLALRDAPARDELELPTDLIRRFMVTPPPDDLLDEPEDAGGTNTEDPGLQDREEAGGEAAAEEEGRVGREDATQEQTEMEGPITGGGAAERVSHLGLLGAIRGGEGQSNALTEALQGPSIADLLGGLGSSQTVMGRGSGGLGLRGTGSGGGGTGRGTLFGAGAMGTGVGAGRGAGGGRGSGGPGARGRPAQEVRVQMTTAAPRVSGYLSPEQIMRVVRRNQSAVRYCYETEFQRNPNLRGRIEIRWRIARNGTVSSASLASSTMGNGHVEGCIVRQVRRWRFDEPDGGEVDVNFPFIFGTGG
ncbi:MAG: AgmX/PglI C-terminal domain-containing protein [Sandaracinaceae bacterium]|nr:AgmX/PglI C-terminal domain-containing protein [Sandaracinaceae bacterium]